MPFRQTVPTVAVRRDVDRSTDGLIGVLRVSRRPCSSADGRWAPTLAGLAGRRAPGARRPAGRCDEAGRGGPRPSVAIRAPVAARPGTTTVTFAASMAVSRLSIPSRKPGPRPVARDARLFGICPTATGLL